MKLLLYTTKAKPYLYDLRYIFGTFCGCKAKQNHFENLLLNGKIVAECDFEVEKIYYSPMFCNYTTWSLGKDELLNKSCLTYNELKNYLGTKDVIGNNGYNGYAIHIKNLHIFDKPKKTSEYNTYNRNGKVHIANIPIYTSPQNMMYAFDYYGNPFVLISIKPEWLCKILNGEKTIEVRKKVLKEMMKND